MARCAAIKANGERCKIDAMPSSDRCWSHDESTAEARRRRASKGGKRGGRGRPQVEIPGIKAQLQELSEQVLAGEIPTGPAAVANQIINTRLRAIEIERKVKEAEETEERLEAIERVLKGRPRAI